ncbi:MAG: methyltransferase [Gammaproteobacteria bacterium]|nr:methyltransferase [Gammaproteobacteria bacterium]MDH5239641.1 methyltransferase [Gammaproteobacteria bacterium]
MSELPRLVRPNVLVRAVCLLWLVPKREFLKRFRVGRTVAERVSGLELVILPDVFNPVVFRTGRFFAESLKELLPADRDAEVEKTALDLGTGSGVLAITAAKFGYSVDAVDLNDEAVRCARDNAERNNVGASTRVFHGDLFAPLPPRKYDLILFSPPSFRGKPASKFGLCWQAEDVFERFAAELPGRLAKDGQALILQTSDGDEEGLVAALAETGLCISIAKRRHFGVEILTIYRLQHCA